MLIIIPNPTNLYQYFLSFQLRFASFKDIPLVIFVDNILERFFKYKSLLDVIDSWINLFDLQAILHVLK